jgi:hypothetical protein
MRRALISCVIVVGVLGTLMLRAAAEPQGGAAQPPAAPPRRPAATAPAQPPPEFTATGFADLAARVELLQKEQAKLVQHLKGETVQFSDCARVGFKTVQSGGAEPFSCPNNKVIQSIYVGPRSSGVAAFRLELDVVCCAVTLKAAPPPPTR